MCLSRCPLSFLWSSDDDDGEEDEEELGEKERERERLFNGRISEIVRTYICWQIYESAFLLKWGKLLLPSPGDATLLLLSRSLL